MEVMGTGGAGVAAATFLTPGAQQDLRNGEPKLTGVQSLTYMGDDDVVDRDITRHGGKVARVLCYSFATTGPTHGILIYLTAEGLFTDYDIVED